MVSGGSWTWWPQVRSAFSRVGCDTHRVSKARTFLVNIQISNFSLKILKSGNIDFIDQRGTERLRPFYRVRVLCYAPHYSSSRPVEPPFPTYLIDLPPQAFGFALADSVTQHAGGQASHLLTSKSFLTPVKSCPASEGWSSARCRANCDLLYLRCWEPQCLGYVPALLLWSQKIPKEGIINGWSGSFLDNIKCETQT